MAGMRRSVSSPLQSGGVTARLALQKLDCRRYRQAVATKPQVSFCPARHAMRCVKRPATTKIYSFPGQFMRNAGGSLTGNEPR